MASGQSSLDDPRQMKDNPDPQATFEAEKEAVETAKTELRQTMAEVTENPPREKPPPPSLSELNYEDPRPDPYNKAISYLEQHNILQIFQHMTANIIFQKPENPLDFMISEIAQMKEQRDAAKK